ncbi:MAG: lactate racemase domain-containing protein [Gemmataceae bacterium]|nr:lactate racemase domain-containing protein [Gemmataceae bacterium]
MEFLHEGHPAAVIDERRAGELLDGLLDQLRQRGPLSRVLILPPDVTRLHSWAGFLTAALFERLRGRADMAILPAVGTHVPMTADEIERMFPGVPPALFHVHDWRHGVVPLGEIPAAFVHDVSEGKLDFPVRVEVDRLLVEGRWDVILSVGQLVPHEVVGIANHNKNVFIGAGGSDLINKSHWLGAVYGIERVMGRAVTPVRRLLDYASERMARHLPIVYLLTVRARGEGGALVTRGLYAGDDGACFRLGAELCRQVNLDRLERAPSKVVVYLDPLEYKSTWLGNKAVYRTRMAIADGGELIVLAPGVRTFGEDPAIDWLVRRFGYRGTPATLEQVRTQPELAANLSAAAHLIHGSSEGRFTVTYCPGHLSRAEVEGVGFAYSELGPMLKHYPPERLHDGWNTLPDGEEVFFISNPALGLWGTAERFAAM